MSMSVWIQEYKYKALGNTIPCLPTICCSVTRRRFCTLANSSINFSMAGKACQLCGLVSLQLLLLLWSVAGVLFSALAVGTCEFVSIPGADIPPNPDAGGATFTGLIGLFRIQERDSSGNSYCVETPGYVIDQFGIYFKVAQLMGVIALTTGGVATIVLLMTFLIEMCCLVSGMQYGLGIMYVVAAVSQGLTFMVIGDSACNQSMCSTSTSSIWSIVATCLFFIAMIQSFAAPFPKEKICSRETCCQCCNKKDDAGNSDDEDEPDEKDVEAAATTVDGNDAAIAAGVAAGAGAAAVAAAAAADEDEETQKIDEQNVSGEGGTETALGATTCTATVEEGNEEEAMVDMTVLDEDNAALDREEAARLAAVEEAQTKSSSV